MLKPFRCVLSQARQGSPARIKGRLFLFLAVALLAAGCRNTPGYIYDIFTEMHYSQSYRTQESPRLQAPSQSVPITGREVAYDFVQAGSLKNPVPRNEQTLKQAANLYSVNCSMCHGVNADGKSYVADAFVAAGAGSPINLNSDRVRALKEGELFWRVTNGFGNMPGFGKLLTAEDRWTLVRFIRNKAGQE